MATEIQLIEVPFTFTSECWIWQAENQVSWHFVTLPKNQSEEIKFFYKNLHGKRRGWGSVRVKVNIGSSEWQTSIFPSTSLEAYLLPLKKAVRNKENIHSGSLVNIALTVIL